MMQRFLGGLAAILLAGCGLFEHPDVEKPCEGTVTCELVVSNFAPALRRGETLVVHGRECAHTTGLTIRSIKVGGYTATPDERAFNYAVWTADLPFFAVEGLPREGDEAQVEVMATDSCGNHTLEILAVPLERADARALTQLTLEHVLPPAPEGQRGFVPVNGAVPVELVVTANPEARGLTVDLTAEGVAFRMGDTEADLVGQVSVTLAGCPDDACPATARVLAYGHHAGLATVTVTGDGQSAATIVPVAGPPTITPGPRITLAAGERVHATVTSAGHLRQCWASPAAGLSITTSDPREADLMMGVVTPPTDADTLGLDLRFQGPDAATAIVVCDDAYGQSSQVDVVGEVE